MAAKPKDDDRAALRQAQLAAHVRPTLAAPPAHFTLAEVRRLIALMNSSDLSEISIEHADTHMRLVLRRVVEVIGGTPVDAAMSQVMLPNGASLPAPALAAALDAPAVQERLFITAPIVGTFYPAFNPTHKPLVQVGDLVREGQLVGGIETLNVMNEVEAQVAGRVDEILVEPGQPVEYGQQLIALIPA